MAATTTNGIPYPTATDAPNVPADVQALATFLDPILAWQAYTPVIGGTGWSLGGGGTIAGTWCKIGKTVHFRVVVTLGTSGYGTGGMTVTLPTASDGVNAEGVQQYFDTSGAVRYGGAVLIQTTTATPYVGPAAAGGSDRGVTSTVPVASGTGDTVTICGTYKAA